MPRPTDADIQKAIRFHAAKLLKADSCPCPTCLFEHGPTRITIGILCWLTGRRFAVEDETGATFAQHLADLYDREDIAKLAADPRLESIVPGILVDVGPAT